MAYLLIITLCNASHICLAEYWHPKAFATQVQCQTQAMVVSEEQRREAKYKFNIAIAECKPIKREGREG
jgi:hypothetical protein